MSHTLSLKQKSINNFFSKKELEMQFFEKNALFRFWKKTKIMKKEAAVNEVYSTGEETH